MLSNFIDVYKKNFPTSAFFHTPLHFFFEIFTAEFVWIFYNLHIW